MAVSVGRKRDKSFSQECSLSSRCRNSVKGDINTRPKHGDNRNELSYPSEPTIYSNRRDKRAVTMFTNLKRLLAVASLFSLANSYVIGPGTGLRSKDSGVEVVIFEHTDFGTGGLVLNCAAPLNIGSLNIPRFQAFKELPLMLGNGLAEDDDGGTSTVSLGEVSPWFWLHDLDDIPGSFVLDKAAGPLYMGGDIEEATKRLQEEKIDPKGRFKFFRRYVTWQAGELEQALNDGEWEAMEQDPEKALKPVMPSFRLL